MPSRAIPRTISAALETLTGYIDAGFDYCDAEWKATTRHHVSAERLRAAYDALGRADA